VNRPQISAEDTMTLLLVLRPVVKDRGDFQL
jgi:hypothetical protein